MENKEDAIEVNKISRHQMRRLKAKEKKVKPLSRKIYLKFYNKWPYAQKIICFACCHDVGKLHIICIYFYKFFLAIFLKSKLKKWKLFVDLS